MRTTWASPEGESQVKRMWKAKRSRLGSPEKEGISPSVVFSGWVQKGLHLLCPSCCLGKQILLLFIFPTEDRQKTQVGSCLETNCSHAHAPPSYTPASEGGSEASCLKLHLSSIHKFICRGLLRSECMNKEADFFLS